MGLLSFLNPETAYQNVRDIVKDIGNYAFYRKQISVIDKSGILSRNKMRTDWLKRVYYVVNLEPETLMASDSAELEKSRVFESVSKIQTTLMDHNLFEIVEVSTKRIKTQDYYAYLVWVKYRKTTNWKSWINLVAYAGIIYLATVLGIKAYDNFGIIQAELIRIFTAK